MLLLLDNFIMDCWAEAAWVGVETKHIVIQSSEFI